MKEKANFTYSGGFCLFLEDFLHLHSQIFDQLHSIYFFHFDCLYKLFMFLKDNTQDLAAVSINVTLAAGKSGKGSVLMGD